MSTKKANKKLNVRRVRRVLNNSSIAFKNMGVGKMYHSHWGCGLSKSAIREHQK